MRGQAALAVLVVAVVSSGVRAEEKSFDSNGVKIAFLDEGKGEAVVLLHGFSASATEMWVKSPLAKTQLLPHLARDYRVVALDFRGHGKSDKPHDPKKYGGEMAEDVVRLLDHLKIKKAHVVGYSMGAWVAGKLLATHPDRLLSVTFGGSGPLFRPSKEFMDPFTATAESLEQGKGIGPLVIAGTPEGEPKPTPEQVAVINKLFLGGKDQKALSAVFRGMNGMEVTEDNLKANTVPVQFVYGRLERQPNVDLMSGSRKVLPKAEVTVVEQGDHVSTAGSPEFQAAVLKFLQKHRQ
jgi:pimeloyl-ACP methyl ester carboxylesterase